VLHASHPNAALTPRARWKLAHLVVEQRWTLTAAARRFEVDPKTARRWAGRYAALCAAGHRPEVGDMQDRSSRPLRCPTRTPRPVVKRIVRLRWRQRLGPVEIGHQLGLPASTVHAVLVRCRLHRLSHLDRRTGEPIRRYEHNQPGALIHVDVKKLGNIPDGGGWRYVGRVPGGGLAYLVDRSSPPGNSATGRPLPGASCNQAMRKCAEFPAHQLIRSGFTTGVARPTDADSRPRTTESADQRTGLSGVARTRACRTKASGRQRP